MNIKEFFATLGIEVDEADWKQADAVLSSVEHGLELVGSAAEFASEIWNAFVGDTVEGAVEISKLATVMGVSTNQAQEWAYAAQQSGLSADDLTQLVAELAENLGEAAGGSGEAADAFKSLGLAMKDSNGKLKETPVALNEIADKLAKMADGQKKTAIITGLFGEEGIKLLPVLNQGSAGLKKYAEEARTLGLILDENAVTKSRELSLQLKTLGGILDSVQASIGMELIPLLVEVAKGFQAWWKINGAMIKQRLHEVFSLLSPVLKVLLFIVSTLAKVLVFLIDNWKLVALVLGRILLPILWEMLIANAQLIISWIAVGAEAAAAGASAAGAWLRAVAPLVLFLLVLEDIWGWFNGKDSLIGGIIDAWADDWSAFLDSLLTVDADDWWITVKIKEALAYARELLGDLSTIGDDATNAYRATVALATGGTYESVQAERARLAFEENQSGLWVPVVSDPKTGAHGAEMQPLYNATDKEKALYAKQHPEYYKTDAEVRNPYKPGDAMYAGSNTINNPSVTINLPDGLQNKEEIVSHIRDSVSDIFGGWLGEAKNGAK